MLLKRFASEWKAKAFTVSGQTEIRKLCKLLIKILTILTKIFALPPSISHLPNKLMAGQQMFFFLISTDCLIRFWTRLVVKRLIRFSFLYFYDHWQCRKNVYNVYNVQWQRIQCRKNERKYQIPDMPLWLPLLPLHSWDNKFQQSKWGSGKTDPVKSLTMHSDHTSSLNPHKFSDSGNCFRVFTNWI